jgi:hypothetical protein
LILAKVSAFIAFYISRIESSTNTRTFKKDKFFKHDFRFYAGALIAIDSAKTLGLPIDVEIYDSQETKNTSKLPRLYQAINYRWQMR